MVISTATKSTKSSEKNPASKIKKHLDVELEVPVSPNSSSADSLEDEVSNLRARNKILTNALKEVQESASNAVKKNFDLVWFARYRSRYPNHDASKRIQQSEEHREDLDLLKSDDADYHHGFHAGVLATARMFKEHAEGLDVAGNDESLLNEDASKHQERVIESRKSFERRKSLPQVNVGEFPEH